MIIYKTVNLINNKIYFGQGKIIKAAIKKYGRENFFRINIYEGLTKISANFKEKFWIKYFNSDDPVIGYNISPGGEGGNVWGVKENHPMYGKHHSDETKIKMSLTKSGRELSAEHKHSLSLVQMGNKNASGNKGKKHSEEIRNKLSLIRKGKKNPKVSIALKGRPKSDETKRRMRESQKLRWLRERVSHAEISL